MSRQWYQGGVDLESKTSQIFKDTYLKIEKVRLNHNTRRKEALVTLVNRGDWFRVVDYKDAILYIQPNGSKKLIDVKDVEVKGKKRKLLLSAEGRVYKLRKQAEKRVKVGYF